MLEPEATVGLAKNWIPKLVEAGAKIWTARRDELNRIFNEFGDSELLAKAYVEPDCQTVNPANYHEEESLPTWANRVPIRKWINEFLRTEPKLPSTDGRNVLFVLSDAGMGKSSLLMMLKLTHLLRFWPDGLDFRLLKLGDTTLDDIAGIEVRKKTVLLLDALDEDPTAWGRIDDRLTDLLRETRNFRQVIITSRTQFFPKGGKVPLEQPGKVELAGFVCNLLYLSPFNDEQVREYLEKIYPNTWMDRFKKWVTEEDNELLQKAARVVLPMQSLRMRPMLLAYIQDLMDSEIHDWGEYPVYKALVRHWLLREEREKGAGVTSEELWTACRTLALELHFSGEWHLSLEKLEELRDDHPAIQHLTGFDFGGRSLLNKTSEGAYRFAHYSIQEFLVAHSLLTGTLPEFPEKIRATDQLWRFVFSGIVESPEEQLEAMPWSRLELDNESDILSLVVQDMDDEVQKKLLERGESWPDRQEMFLQIPELVQEPAQAFVLVDLLRRRTRDAHDLFFLDQAAAGIAAKGSDFRTPARRIQALLYDHLPTPSEDIFQWIETPLDGRVSLWCEIPAGEFQMGSSKEEGGIDGERPRHRVKVESAFRVAAVPVTNAQYAAFDPDHAPHRWDGLPEHEIPYHPVVNVTWYEAMSFCRWLSASFPWAHGARLLTEEEWEYVCRAGSESRYWSGDSEADLKRVGWYDQNSNSRTHRVGEKAANPWGLYDVHGNVWEWTLASWPTPYSNRRSGHTVNPSTVDPADLAAPRGGRRVLRGGSYWNSALGARSAYRDALGPATEVRNRGFRVLLPAPDHRS